VKRPIRRVAIALLVLFAALAVATTYQQAVAGTDHRTDPRNPRVAFSLLSDRRGTIMTADGQVVARSVAEDGSYRRVYPWGERYAHLVGYASALFGETGIERARSEDLRGPEPTSIEALMDRIFRGATGPRGIGLTVVHTIQTAAAAALGEETGAIVALDPSTGDILAYVSQPAFDPNTLLELTSVAAGEALTRDPQQPLVDRVSTVIYPPGSTFKVVTTTTGLETSIAFPDTLLLDPIALQLPGSTATITNYGGGVCNDGDTVSLDRAVAVSCNTAFASLGMEVGAEALVAAAEAAGFNREIPFALPTVASTIPDAGALDDLAVLAQTAIGGRDVRATPLLMALIAGALVNDGIVMAPHVVAEIVDPDGSVTESHGSVWTTAMSPETAVTIAGMLEGAVTDGTGHRAAIDGATVGGKTGTAEVPDGPPHTWFMGFAVEPAGRTVAVAVLIESGGALGGNGTGGSVAAPVAQTVFEEWLAWVVSAPG
jgi:peptidoglycan glycosyltransferase